MITFITGKPGDGKTLYSVALIVKALRETEKFIVTNIPLQPGALREHLAREGCEAIDLDTRLKVIADSEVSEFFRHRSGDYVLPWSPDSIHFAGGNLMEGRRDNRWPREQFNEWMKAEFLKLGEPQRELARKPCLYVIDEAHEYFSAREWATNGRATLFYASKHRHLHDEVLFVTQVMENVEKQLRGLASETVVVRNHLRRSWGPFKLRPVFKVRAYYGIPAPNVSPYSVSDFALDPAGVAGCYQTTGALGVHTTPEKISNKGRLPWWTMVVGGVAAVLGCVAAITALPALGGRAARSFIVPASSKVASSVLPMPGQTKADAKGLTQQAKRREADAARGEPLEPPTGLVVVTGVTTFGNRVTVQLSDGRAFTEEEPYLRVTRTFVECPQGTRYFYAKPYRPAPVAKPAAEKLPEKPDEPKRQAVDAPVACCGEDDPAVPAPPLGFPSRRTQFGAATRGVEAPGPSAFTNASQRPAEKVTQPAGSRLAPHGWQPQPK